MSATGAAGGPRATRMQYSREEKESDVLTNANGYNTSVLEPTRIGFSLPRGGFISSVNLVPFPGADRVHICGIIVVLCCGGLWTLESCKNILIVRLLGSELFL